MAILKLKNGIEVLLDDEDLPRVSMQGWVAHYNPLNKRYYIVRAPKKNDKNRTKSTLQYLSRELMNVTDPKFLVDYINHNPLDNRKANLRVCSRRQVTQNLEKKEHTTSKYSGVRWDNQKKRWRAEIRICGKKRHLGRFLNEKDAAISYEKAVRELTGEELFCKMNKQKRE
jgi:hypothetical protein